MDNIKLIHCRFCAEPRDTDKLVNLTMDPEKYEDTASKLKFLNAIYIDIANSKLPKTICFVCYESLTNAYNFLHKVKAAQDLIINIFAPNLLKVEASSDKFTFEDLIADENEPNIKQESSSSSKNRPDTQILVKIEPKEEMVVFEPDNDTNSTGCSPGPPDFDDGLNVQDIIDAAMSGTPFTNDVTIYAKEMSDINKKEISEWKDYPWLCSHCNIEFQDIATLRKHSKIVHRKCSAFMCIDCKTFTNNSFSLFVKHVSNKHRTSLR